MYCKNVNLVTCDKPWVLYVALGSIQLRWGSYKDGIGIVSSSHLIVPSAAL
jgi:hypothetical protein